MKHTRGSPALPITAQAARLSGGGPSSRARTASKMAEYSGSVSGGASILSSYTICHQVCLAFIAALGLIGITVTGMPLAFLSAYTTLFWGIGVALLGVTIFLHHIHPGCISGKLVLANAGFLIAGVPFEAFINLRPMPWIAGGFAVATAILWWMLDRPAFSKSSPLQGPVREPQAPTSSKPCCRTSSSTVQVKPHDGKTWQIK